MRTEQEGKYIGGGGRGNKTKKARGKYMRGWEGNRARRGKQSKRKNSPNESSNKSLQYRTTLVMKKMDFVKDDEFDELSVGSFPPPLSW